MKTKNTLLILAISGILAACSSSNQETVVTGKLTQQNPSGDTTEIESQNIDQITVAGETISLIPPDDHYGNGYAMWSPNETQTIYLLTPKSLEYAKVGFVRNYTSDTEYTTHTFYQGNPTNNMPSAAEGDINYTGSAEVVTSKAGTGLHQLGTATFTLNMANNTLIGEMTFGTDQGWSTAYYPSFTASVSGNTFSTEGVGTQRIQAKGGFYGDNAAELAGDFVDTERDARFGIFSAKKQ